VEECSRLSVSNWFTALTSLGHVTRPARGRDVYDTLSDKT
jgi:hypothetical protein